MVNKVMQFPALWKEMKALHFGGANQNYKVAEF